MYPVLYLRYVIGEFRLRDELNEAHRGNTWDVNCILFILNLTQNHITTRMENTKQVHREEIYTTIK